MTKITRRTLSRAGFDVTVTNRSFGVLNLVAETSPDIVVMDMNMPGLRGTELLELLRADPALSATRVLFFSGIEEHELEQLASAGGADAYLHKSATPDELISTLRAIPASLSSS